MPFIQIRHGGIRPGGVRHGMGLIHLEWDETGPETIRGGWLSIGNFDGVHRGHQQMLGLLKSRAAADGRSCAAVTFDPHPLSLLRPDRVPPPLTTVAQRAALLQQAGADHVCVIKTSPSLLQLSAEEFFHRVLRQQLDVAGLVEGPNFFFGKDRRGNVTMLRGLCQQSGVAFEVLPPVMVDDQWVSSSVIRSLLTDGQVREAVTLLGRPYVTSGVVVTGAQRGRELGIPTANIEGVEVLLPRHGVYAGQCTVDGNTYAAAIHLGPNATFAEGTPKLEVHLIDFVSDLYGRTLDVAWIAQIRETRKFASVADLIAQMQRDLQEVRRLATPTAMP
jgi:riboflavin kinase / FMN adenylyltransferase